MGVAWLKPLNQGSLGQQGHQWWLLAEILSPAFPCLQRVPAPTGSLLSLQSISAGELPLVSTLGGGEVHPKRHAPLPTAISF